MEAAAVVVAVTASHRVPNIIFSTFHLLSWFEFMHKQNVSAFYPDAFNRIFYPNSEHIEIQLENCASVHCALDGGILCEWMNFIM